MKGEIFSAAKWNVVENTSQEAMKKMLKTNLKDSSIKLLIMSAFTLRYSTDVESAVLPTTGLTLK